MKIRSGLITNSYIYETTYNWPDNAAAQCGGGSIDGIGSECFIEVFIKGISYIRGSGSDLRVAEEKAWAIYQKYQNCEHTFIRTGDFSSSGKCIHCNMRKDKQFSYATCCSVCQAEASAHNISSTYFCYKHYKEQLEATIQDKKMTNSDLVGEEKNLWINQVLELAGMYQNKTDEDIRDIFYAHSNGFFEYMTETCRHYHEKFEIGKKIHFIDIYSNFEVTEEAYKAAFEVYIVDNKNVVLDKDVKNSRLYIEDFIKSFK